MIAQSLGAIVRREPLEGDLSGLLFKDGARVLIGVNASHAPVRQRFTVAHEIGHLLLHGRDDLHVDRDFRVHRRDDRSSQAIDAQEIAANAFAAELLMPAMFVRSEVSGTPIAFDDDCRVQDLARTFEVSVQAMVIRLTNLHLLASPAESGIV
jgi:Zn-dependent peptidase ImmA (M78 family)